MSKIVSTRSQLDSNELKTFLKYIINNNRYLQSEGKVPVAVNIESQPGIGKTSTILQVAEEMGLQLVRINLAMIEEVGELVGFPIRQFQLCKKEDLGKIKSKKITKKVNKPVQEVIDMPVVASIILPIKPERDITPLITKKVIVDQIVTTKKQVLEGGKFVVKEVETTIQTEEDVEDVEAMQAFTDKVDIEYAVLLEAYDKEVARLEAEHAELVSNTKFNSITSNTNIVIEDEVIETLETGTQDDICMWIDEHAVDEYLKRGYEFTGGKRTAHCAPEWIANASSGLVFLLDDYSRCDPRFTQALMSLIETQKYISWSLPADTTIILSTNPDDGQNFVVSQDKAQTSRYITTNLKFSVETWSEWAERSNVDGRAINFLNLHPEVITDEVNPRSMTMFFNTIASIKDFDKELPLIQMLGEASVGPDVSLLFTMFINNKLDKLVSPKDMLLKDGEPAMISEMISCIGSGDNYRADIASTLATRLINYTLLYSETNTISDKIIKRLIMFMTNPDIFTDDLKYVLVKRILNGNRAKFNKLMLNENVIAMTIK